MAVIEGGTSGSLAEVGVGPALGQHAISKPTAHGALGHYSYGALSGIIPAALAANSEIFQFRWSDATRFAVINEIKIAASVTTTFFAAGVPVQIDLLRASAWSAVGTGGTRPAVAALLKKRSTGMGSSLLGANDVGVITTAALGAGTKTLEGLSIATILAGGPITASLKGTFIEPGTMLFRAEIGDGQHPLVLAQNEGFVIRSVAVPATGTWMASFTVDWTEVTTF